MTPPTSPATLADNCRTTATPSTSGMPLMDWTGHRGRLNASTYGRRRCHRKQFRKKSQARASSRSPALASADIAELKSIQVVDFYRIDPRLIILWSLVRSQHGLPKLSFRSSACASRRVLLVVVAVWLCQVCAMDHQPVVPRRQKLRAQMRVARDHRAALPAPQFLQHRERRSLLNVP
jgi:hypothetical protein